MVSEEQLLRLYWAHSLAVPGYCTPALFFYAGTLERAWSLPQSGRAGGRFWSSWTAGGCWLESGALLAASVSWVVMLICLTSGHHRRPGSGE